MESNEFDLNMKLSSLAIREIENKWIQSLTGESISGLEIVAGDELACNSSSISSYSKLHQRFKIQIEEKNQNLSVARETY